MAGPITIPQDIQDEAATIVNNISFVMPDPSAIRDEIEYALNAERERWEDKVDGLSSDLTSAVEVAFKRGATEWTRLNYPEQYTRLMGEERKGE